MAPALKLLGGKLTLTGPVLGEDALWLAASIPQLPPDTLVLDAACGNGVAALALLTRQPQLTVTAVDINPVLIARAKSNAKANKLNLSLLTTNLLAPFPLQPFTVVMCNPPFHAQERGHIGSPSKTMPKGDFPRWLAALTSLTATGGALYLILHSACQNELTHFAQTHPAALTLTPLQTAPDKPAKRLLATLHPTQPFSLTENPPLPAYQESLRQSILHNAKGL
ncbi:MAG: methyltransferase [Proteobacteria bacterium]|nr:methyltransferase [Pseudomonadota bacterium]